MIECIIKADKVYNLFGKEKDITVAVSGGADSVALLHGLYSIKDAYGFNLTVAHYHHGIRGDEADRDFEFVKELAHSLQLPFTFEKGNAIEYAKQNGISLETAARELRYDFLFRVAKGIIATAHTANDNFETMIFNIVRGTSLNGVRGIPPKRDNIIRPLILCDRETIENYCKDNNLSFVTDSTNLVDDCSRNIIRHKVIPVLNKINSASISNASKLSISLSEDNSFIEIEAQKEYLKRNNGDLLDVSDFSCLHPSIAKRVIISFYKQSFALIPDMYHIDKIYDVCLGKIQRTGVPTEKTAARLQNFLRFEETEKPVQQFDVKTRIIPIEEYKKLQKVHELFSINAVDYDKITGEIIKIPKNNSDKIKLAGSSVTKNLKKLLTEKKIPLEFRKNLPVYADDNGIIWVYNVGVADRIKTDKLTKTVLYFEAKSL